MGSLNTLERTIGLEFEFTNPKLMMDEASEVHLAKLGVEWVRDGSIRSPHGKELVVQPMQGDKFITGISTIIALIQELGPTIDASCGFHVHIGARDLSFEHLRNLMVIWYGIEKEVYGSLVDISRRKNQYCIPLRQLRKTGEKKYPWQMDLANREEMLKLSEAGLCNYLYGLLYGTTDANALHYVFAGKRTAENGCRYAALNMHSYFHRRTVEYRLKEATLDSEECMYWPLFCAWLVENAKRQSVEQIAHITSLGTALEVLRMPRRLKDWVATKLENRSTVSKMKPVVEDEVRPMFAEDITPDEGGWIAER